MSPTDAAIEKRFDKIEDKLDTITDALIQLARAEEKLMAFEIKMENMTSRINNHSEKIDSLAKISIDTNSSLGFIIRVFWVSLPVVLTAFAWIIVKG